MEMTLKVGAVLSRNRTSLSNFIFPEDLSIRDVFTASAVIRYRSRLLSKSDPLLPTSITA